MATEQELGTRIVADTSSSTAAGNWIRSKWEQWKELELEFPRLMHRAAVVAAESTDPETRRTARDSIERTGRLWDMHAYVTAKLEAIAGLIPSGLGQAGIVWPAAVIALALSVAWVITHYDAELRVVRMMEEGALSPDEARQLLEEVEGGGGMGGAIGGVADVLKALPIVVALGAAAWIWAQGRKGAQ